MLFPKREWLKSIMISLARVGMQMLQANMMLLVLSRRAVLANQGVRRQIQATIRDKLSHESRTVTHSSPKLILGDFRAPGVKLGLAAFQNMEAMVRFLDLPGK